MKPRTSVTRQLRYAFLIISALSLVAALVAFWGFHAIQRAQEEIVDRALPSMLIIRNLAEAAHALVDEDNNFDDVRTVQGLDQRSIDIEARMAAMRGEIRSLLAETHSSDRAEAINGLLSEIASNIVRLGELAQERIALIERQEAMAAAGQDASGALETLLKAQIAELTAELATASQAFASSTGQADETRAGSYAGIQEAAAQIERLIEARFRTLQLGEALGRVVLELAVDMVERERAGFERNLRAVTDLAGALRGEDAHRRASRHLQLMTEISEDREGVFSVSARRLQVSAETRRLRRANRELVARISATVAGLVATSNAEIGSATMSVSGAINAGRAYLVFIVLVVFAAALFFFVISRHLVARLNLLTDRTLQLADGHLDVEIDVPGNDEIVQMAQALGTFRDTARRLLRREGQLRGQTRELTEANGQLLNAQKALKQQTIELRRSNEELEQFAYVASHDLQEPLRMVSSYVELIKRRYQDRLDQDANEFIGFAVEGAARMKNLLNDLLQYSRVGRAQFDFVAVDLQKIMGEVARDLEFFRQQTNGRIGFSDLPVVRGDKGLIYRVLQNLVQNGLKFSADAAPQVIVSAEAADDRVTVCVKDNGIGIDPKFRNKIFEIFQRLHTREEYSGNGIGLAIAQRIVERHGGRIWFESTSKPGTVFKFTLPAATKDDVDGRAN